MWVRVLALAHVRWWWWVPALKAAVVGEALKTRVSTHVHWWLRETRALVIHCRVMQSLPAHVAVFAHASVLVWAEPRWMLSVARVRVAMARRVVWMHPSVTWVAAHHRSRPWIHGRTSGPRKHKTIVSTSETVFWRHETILSTAEANISGHEAGVRARVLHAVVRETHARGTHVLQADDLGAARRRGAGAAGAARSRRRRLEAWERRGQVLRVRRRATAR